MVLTTCDRLAQMRVPEAEAMAPTSRTEAGSALMERRMKVEKRNPNSEAQFLISSPSELVTEKLHTLGKAIPAVPVIAKPRRRRRLSTQRLRELAHHLPQNPLSPKVTGSLFYDCFQLFDHRHKQGKCASKSCSFVPRVLKF